MFGDFAPGFWCGGWVIGESGVHDMPGAARAEQRDDESERRDEGGERREARGEQQRREASRGAGEGREIEI
jgi:hypothetical protein